MKSKLEKVLNLLDLETFDDNNLTKVLITIPNIVDKDITLMFNGWNIKLHDDGTWTAKKTC
jgi:hypothetical protein